MSRGVGEGMANVIEAPSLSQKVFFSYALEKQRLAYKNNQKFVYYTSAEVAASILINQEIWMRNSTCMNDFSEVEYGLDLLKEAWKNKSGTHLKNQLNSLFLGISDEIEKIFNQWTPTFRLNTFLTCISEHDSKSEDDLGRLSMWRAYGGNSGVALVLNNDVLLSVTDALKAYTSPVAYFDRKLFFSEMDKVANNIQNNAEHLIAFGKENIVNSTFEMLRAAVLCIKHPAFKEEREWRVIYSPAGQQPGLIKKHIETINGVPQLIYKIPLQDAPEAQLENLHISKFLSHIIIGPTQYPTVLSAAFVELLNNAGVAEPHKKVRISNIPLRR